MNDCVNVWCNGLQDNKESETNEHLEAIAKALSLEGPPTEYVYEERDVMLYNLGIGAKRTELDYVLWVHEIYSFFYLIQSIAFHHLFPRKATNPRVQCYSEGADNFQALPTFGVIPPFSAEPAVPFDDLVPNFNPMMLLHGEQYLEIRSWPIPTSGKLVSRAKLLEVVDKGNASIVRTGISTVNAANGKEVFYNEMTVFLRGSGGFGGIRKPADRGASTARNAPPEGKTPDAVVESMTTEEQAAVYRLSGDYNPLHVDPAFAKMGGFKVPILHGLCSMGVAGKAVYERYGRFRNLKVRFAGTVDPGQTLITEMWKVGDNKVVFQTKVKETGKLAIAGGGAELVA